MRWRASVVGVAACGDASSRRPRSILYRPVSISSRRTNVWKWRGVAWRSWTRTGRCSRSRTRWSCPIGRRKERYFDPEFFRLEAEQLWSRVWQMACRLEEIPRPHDYVEYDDPRPVGRRGAHRGHGRHGVPERLPPPGRQGRRRPGHLRDRVHLPVPRLVLRARRDEHLRLEAQLVLRAQHAARRPRPAAGAVRDVGRLRVDQPRPRRAAAAAVHRALRHDPGGLAARVDAHRVVVRRPPAGELEARRRGVHGAVPRHRGAPAAGRPPALPAAGPGGVRPARVARRRDPLPAHDERGHGRHGPRQRRAHRRGPPRHRAARRPGGAIATGTHAQRRGRAVAPRAGQRSPTSTSSRPRGCNEPMGYCFPHFFVLPMYSSASSYRFRPLGPRRR